MSMTETEFKSIRRRRDPIMFNVLLFLSCGRGADRCCYTGNSTAKRPCLKRRIKRMGLVLLLLLNPVFLLSNAFVMIRWSHHGSASRCRHRTQSCRTPITTTSLLSLYNDPMEDSTNNDWLSQEQNSTIAASTTTIYQSLSQRQTDLQRGIGCRYVVHTTRGFLNVHSSCTHEEGPFATDNIVAQLHDGQVIVSVGPPVDAWIQHDHGGWSVGEFQGHTFLVPLKE